MISSTAGSIAGQGGGRGVPCCVAKAALNMLTKLLRFHCSAEGVAIVSLHVDSRLYVDYSGTPMEW